VKEGYNLNKYDLDFENIFEYLGIESFDLEYLKKLIKEELKKIFEAAEKNSNDYIISFDNQIQNLNSEILRYTERLNDPDVETDTKDLIIIKIQELNDKISSLQDNAQKYRRSLEIQQKKMQEGLADVDKITDQYKALKTIANARVYARLIPSKSRNLPQDELEKLRAIRVILIKNKDLSLYVSQRDLISRNVDVANRDQSSFEYVERKVSSPKRKKQDFHGASKKVISNLALKSNKKMSMYGYRVQIGQKVGDKWSLEPRRLYEKELEGTDIQIYDFGTFTYGYMPKPDGKYLYTSKSSSLIGVVRQDEEGKTQIYHGVIYINSYDPKFYIDIPFSNIMMRNAQKNNYGYIGNVSESQYLDSGYEHYLDFSEVDLGKTVTALSYAMNHKGGCNIAKRNLSEIYEYMDQVMRQKVKSKQKSNLEQHVDKSYNNGTYDSIPTRDN
jgi:hypothetical protein